MLLSRSRKRAGRLLSSDGQRRARGPGLAPRHSSTAPTVSPPARRLCVAAILLAIAFCALYAWQVRPIFLSPGMPPGERGLLVFKIVVEMLFAFPAATMLLVAGTYLFARRRREPAPVGDGSLPPVAIVYLCCDDLDREAVESLRRLRYRGPLHLIVHDDAPGGDPRVDRLARQMAGDTRLRFLLLRRPEKTGGKPGALNYVLEKAGHLFEHFLLCDNDSIATDPDAIEKLVARMADPRVAVAQCRNVSVEDGRACAVNRVLSRAVDVFHLFLSMARRHGWCPFVGHNALVRASAVREVGGFTPGCFADDIDLTIRLNLAGYRVAYAEEVPFGEKHPPSYEAFRKRTYKWSYGSMQVLKRHAGTVIRTRALNLAEKWGFFQFIGFYTLQTVLLFYVALFYLAAPFLLRREDFDLAATVVSGTLIPPLIFLPVIAFAVRHRRVRSLPAFLTTCWLGYGAADFPTARGTLDSLLGRPRSWVPTNARGTGCGGGALLAEALFGAALLLVPLFKFPLLLLSPLTFVIAAKFLFIPTMGLVYRDEEDAARPAPFRVPRLAAAYASVVLVLVLLSAHPGPSARGSVEVRGKELLVDGSPFTVRGIHYSPWRPGTGPGRSPYPGPDLVEEDLQWVDRLHANTLLAFDPPGHVLDAAARHRLRVLHVFWIEWPRFGTPAFAPREAEILEAVRSMRSHSSLLGWVLGNEIPSWVVEERGAARVEADLRALYEKVKAVDPAHPVTHGNWPNTRSLDLRFLDLAAFNVYALWPPEVVARGYGKFLREVLAPTVGDRPLLITEFGANSLEAGEEGQARLLGSCWDGLLEAGCVGGVAFEFADEWWKNYSNPKLPGAWWDRVEALDDHATHDADPEENYGLLTGERRVKPAFAAVARMYGAGTAGRPGAVALVVGVISLAAASLVWASRSTERRARGAGLAAVAPVPSGAPLASPPK